MILASILAACQITINQLLKLDTASMQRLAALEGKVLRVTITDWCCSFAVLPHAGGIQLSDTPQSSEDCHISGKLFNLTQVLCQGASSSVLFKHSIDITGDTELAEQLRDIMQRVDVDWEEYLAKALGGHVGQQLAWQLRSVARIIEQTGQTLRQNIVDYCQVEAKYVPGREQVQQFYQDVAKLRDDVERAAARYQRLAQKKSAKKSPEE